MKHIVYGLGGFKAGVEDDNIIDETTIPEDQTSIIRDSIVLKSIDALEHNKDFLKNKSPSNAELAKQIKAITKQVNGLIKLSLRDFSSDDDV